MSVLGVRSSLLPGAVLVSVALLTAACGSSGGGSVASSASPTTTASSTTAASAATFGSGCAGLPTGGAGSIAAMAADSVAMAASHNPLLTQLVSALKTAGLVDTLDSAPAITVFAPTDTAFKNVDAQTLMMAKEHPQTELKPLLEYHVVSGQLTPDQLVGSHQTLQGQSLTVAGSGGEYAVNGTAKIVCGNIKTANATVYVIDGVLMPPATK